MSTPGLFSCLDQIESKATTILRRAKGKKRFLLKHGDPFTGRSEYRKIGKNDYALFNCSQEVPPLYTGHTKQSPDYPIDNHDDWICVFEKNFKQLCGGGEFPEIEIEEPGHTSFKLKLAAHTKSAFSKQFNPKNQQRKVQTYLMFDDMRNSKYGSKLLYFGSNKSIEKPQWFLEIALKPFMGETKDGSYPKDGMFSDYAPLSIVSGYRVKDPQSGELLLYCDKNNFGCKDPTLVFEICFVRVFRKKSAPVLALPKKLEINEESVTFSALKMEKPLLESLPSLPIFPIANPIIPIMPAAVAQQATVPTCNCDQHIHRLETENERLKRRLAEYESMSTGYTVSESTPKHLPIPLFPIDTSNVVNEALYDDMPEMEFIHGSAGSHGGFGSPTFTYDPPFSQYDNNYNMMF